MKHSEEEIRKLVIKILTDLGNDYYYNDEIEIAFENDLYLLWGDPVSNGWRVGIGIPDFQFRDPLGASIGIIIDDDTGDVLNYKEGPGRPVPCTVKPNEQGKYEIHVLGDYLPK